MGEPMAWMVCWGCSWGINGEEQAPAPAERFRLPVLLPDSFLAKMGIEMGRVSYINHMPFRLNKVLFSLKYCASWNI